MAKTFLAGEAAVKLTPNSKDFHRKARSLIALEPLRADVNLVADMKGFRKDAQGKLSTAKLKVDVTPRLDITGFRQKSQAQLDAGKPLTLKVNVRADADKNSVRLAHQAMQAQLDAMKKLTIGVEANPTQASITMGLWRQAQEARQITIKVNADTTAASASLKSMRMLGGRGSGQGRSGAPIGRQVKRAAIGTGITFAPIATQAAVGGLSAITGAASQAAGALGLLPAAITAAGAGFAALGVGIYGVAGAFQALAKESEEAKKATDNTKNQASAARAVAGAVRNIASAERAVGKAQENVRKAQDDLNKARKQAVRDLRDMNDELRLAPLNEKEAALAIKEAQQRLSEAISGGDALEIEGARIDVERSKIDYDILTKQNQDLFNDTMAANAAGVEGAEAVVAAKEGVVDANDAVVASQEAVLDAQDALTAAIEAQTEALTENSAAADAAALAMAKLSPNAREFVLAMRELGPQWTELRKAVQDNLFGNLGDSVSHLANAQLPVLREGLRGVAEMLNRGIRDSLMVFSSASAIEDFNTTLGNTQLMWAGLADTAAPLSQAWIDLSTVGSTFLPRFGTAMADASARFSEWIATMRGTGQMQTFFENSIEMAKQLGRIISNVGHIIGDFFSAGAATGGGFLNTIETATAQLRAFTESAEGMQSMQTFFAGVAEAVRTLAPILTIVAKTIFDTLGPALTDLVIGAGPGIVAMFEGLRAGLQAIAPVMPVLGQALGQIATVLGEVFVSLGPVIKDVIAALAPALGPLATLLGDIIKALLPILPPIAQLIGQLVSGLAPAFSKIVDALAPLITLFIDNLMPVLTPLIDVFVQIADIVGTVLADVFTALTPVIEPLMNVLGQVAGVIGTLLLTAIQALAPFLPPLIDAFVRVVLAVLPLLDPFIQLAMDILPSFIQVITSLMPTVLRLVDILAGLVGYIVPVLIPVLELLGWIVAGVFNGIVDVITWAWDNVVDPIIIALGWALSKLGDLFNWLWNEAIKPAWQGITDAFSWAWDNVIKPVVGYISDAISGLVGTFESVASGIGTAWDKIRESVAKPIVWVIDKVINGAFKSGWNAIADIVPGLDHWNGVDIESIKGLVGGVGFATGGYVSGPGTGTSDSIPARLSNGEFVMRKEAVDRLGKENLDRLNQGTPLRQPQVQSPDGKPHYAMGGIVQDGAYLTSEIQRSMWDAVRTAFPNAQLTSGTRTEDVGSGFDNHMAERAIDLGGPMPEIANWIYGMNKTQPVAELIHWPLQGWENLDNGVPYDFGASTNSQHADHVHWAMEQMVSSDGKMISAAFGGGATGQASSGGGARQWLADKVADLFEKPLRAIGDTIPDFGPSKFGQLPKTAYQSIVDAGLKFVREKLGGSTPGGNNQAGNVPWDISGGAEQWRGVVLEALRRTGHPETEADRVLKQIDIESSGNPNAIATDPSDPNVAAGRPSKGLIQAIDTTYQAHRDPALVDNIYDPLSNVVAGIRYADAEYGDISNIWPKVMGYDTGGIVPPGLTTVNNQTGQNEYMLTPDQMGMVQGLIDVLRMVGATPNTFGGVQPVNVEQVNGKDLTGKDMPVTADVEGKDVTTGEAYGQPLQGAAIDNQTGAYLPGNNVPAGEDQTNTVPFSFKTDTPEWKTAKSLAGIFGFDKQASKIESKADPINGIIAGATQAAPAYAAALAGNPAALMGQIATTTGQWAAKTTTDFATYLPENAGGILESALSGLAGPLIGTVNTGMSQAQLVETMEDVENRKARRTKTGRSRRG
jgi:phage-related protein